MSARSQGGFAHVTVGNVSLAQGFRPLRFDRADNAKGASVAYIGGLHIVFDGRIDNRADLSRSLGLDRVESASVPDNSLVIAAYRRWGRDFASRLLGDFVIAILDRAAGELVCARDHMGNRPLYFFSTPEYFAFASEDEALLGLPGASAKPNPHLVAALFFDPLWGGIDSYDWLLDVRSLAPATMTVVRLSSARYTSQTYWNARDLISPRERPLQEAIEEFDATFGAAVASRIDVHSRPAMLMSGGLDSASIADALSRMNVSGGIDAFDSISAVRPPDIPCFESDQIRRLQALPGCRPHVIQVPNVPLAASNAYETLARTRSHPVVQSLPLIVLGTWMASQQGHDYLLNGGAGDVCSETHDSYLRHYLAARGWRATVAEARAATGHHTYLRGRRLGSLMARAATSRMTVRAFAWLHGKFSESIVQHRLGTSGLNPDFVRNAGLSDLIRQRFSYLRQRAPLSFADVRFDTLWPVGVVHGVETYDRIAGNFGVTMLDPYSDPRVISFFCSLPVDLLTHCGWTKYLVRSALDDRLKKVVWSSDKSHLGGVLRSWQRAMLTQLIRELPIVRSEALVNLRTISARAATALGDDTGDGAVVSQVEREDWRWANYVLPLALWLARGRIGS